LERTNDRDNIEHYTSSLVDLSETPSIVTKLRYSFVKSSLRTLFVLTAIHHGWDI